MKPVVRYGLTITIRKLIGRGLVGKREGFTLQRPWGVSGAGAAAALARRRRGVCSMRLSVTRFVALGNANALWCQVDHGA